MSVATKLTTAQLQALSQASKAASDDDSRSILTCVCIEITPKHIYAVATDSYMIVARIGEALNCESVHAMRMQFLGGIHPVFVAPIGGDDDKSFGLLMPIRIDDPLAAVKQAKQQPTTPQADAA